MSATRRSSAALGRRTLHACLQAAWSLSIRTKIFFGCISLTFATILVGCLALSAQNQLSTTALGIYDNAFQSMSYLRSAQSILLSISRNIADGEKNDAIFVDQMQSALDALDVARDRAMSPRGRTYAAQLQVDVLDLQGRLRQTGAPPARAQFVAIERKFDVAVDIYAGDGLRLRRSVEALVSRRKAQTKAAIAASILTAFAITLMLSRTIVPSIRHAVKIATAIAAGHLDNRIEAHGASETGLLLTALAAMQDGIAEKIAFIETLMARQASSHAAEIALQHARFKAALNNMTLGLCMFDASNTLLVFNKRFVEMFAAEAANGDIASVVLRLALDGPEVPPGQDRDSRCFKCLLADGRTIAVSEEAMDGGGRVVTYDDITEQQHAEARLSHMARHDALTGLPNRILFREELERGILQLRAGGILSLLCLDLDRFKSVNDTLGHPVGDRLLREATARLVRTVGASDMVVRLGGDEFAVIKHASRPGQEAEGLADRLIKVLSLPYEIDGHHISIGASAGIAETGDALDTPDNLLKNADLALYLAKSDGRGIYRLFEHAMDERIQAKRRLELDLRTAITEQQFELFYQPLVSAQGGMVMAFEALLRWHHPERGLVSPAEFIPLAEETGLIIELGVWVMQQSCRDAVTWPSDVKVAINISALQFRCSALIDDVADALARSGLPADRLEIEITESLLLEDDDATLTMLHRLRALGISISMDDFGSGYSSLNYLRRFPFDKIKIDRSFVSNMSEDSEGFAIVRAIISLGQSLHMTVVAEGVETEEQRTMLCDAGCQELQGYLFSRPQPAPATRSLIERFAGPSGNRDARRTSTVLSSITRSDHVGDSLERLVHRKA